MSVNDLKPSRDQQPKVLFVLGGMGMGGAERVAATLLNGWLERGLPASLLTLGETDASAYNLAPEVEHHNVNLLWASANPVSGVWANMRRIRMVRDAITNIAPHVVISFIEANNVLVLAALRQLDIPVIVSERTDPRHYKVVWWRRLMRRLLYPRSSALVVPTEAVATWSRRWMPAHKVEVIVNPLPDFPSPDMEAPREHLILSVGRLVWHKGHRDLIDAYVGSHAQQRDWKLVVLGEGPERRNLEAQIDRLNLQEHVSLPGNTPSPWQWLHRAAIFVLPSSFEGFSNALMEGLAMGCACVAYNCPSGPAELLADDRGVLVPTGDVDALRVALDELVDDEARRLQLAHNGFQGSERYDFDRVTGQWLQLIHRVLAAQQHET